MSANHKRQVKAVPLASTYCLYTCIKLEDVEDEGQIPLLGACISNNSPSALRKTHQEMEMESKQVPNLRKTTSENKGGKGRRIKTVSFSPNCFSNRGSYFKRYICPCYLGSMLLYFWRVGEVYCVSWCSQVLLHKHAVKWLSSLHLATSFSRLQFQGGIEGWVCAIKKQRWPKILGGSVS